MWREMKINGIHHCSMKCTPAELPDVRRFYCDALGLPVVHEWPKGIMPLQYIWLVF